MKKVLILSGSPRKAGNSEILCERFAAGARAAGHYVERFSLAGKQIGFCRACYACKAGPCPQQDAAIVFVQKMLEADVIVLSTPVYFYTMCAQLKALIDRSVMVYPKIVNKEFYYMMTMADTDTSCFKGTIEALRGFVDCCEGSKECGMICAAGVYERGEIRDKPEMQQAYDMGLNC
ncbi:MAG: flavodoxin family protein [Kiritimatiellae bacterium]|nr:flavodoxin family protein [Kiritimatiellia bacterium]